jgi:hypothetical protein
MTRRLLNLLTALSLLLSAAPPVARRGESRTTGRTKVQ